MERTASADWLGTLRGGKGRISGTSGALSSIPFSFATRFGNQLGTNPEELIAAAHAGCFTMALTVELEKLGLKPESLHTDATASLEQVDGRWTISRIHLNVYGQVPDASAEQFDPAAAEAKANCPVSRLLNATITLGTKLLTSDVAAGLRAASMRGDARGGADALH